MAETTAKCEVCEKVSNKKCGKCWNVFYCSKEHQTIAWKNHQKVCRPFQICINEQLGRYIVATKPIQDGEVILQELPLVERPGDSITTTYCMGCLKILDNYMHLCGKCGWALCSEECENNPNHKPECYYFSRRGRKVSPMEFIRYKHGMVPILRCLYQKRFNPEVWQKLTQLKSYWKETDNVVFRRGFDILLNDIFLKNEFSEEEIQYVWGILNGNSFETDTDNMAVYEIASLFEHSCKANCRKIFDSKRMLRIIAGTFINKGDHLSISYITCLRPTFERQKHLQDTRFCTTCECNRCVDVTEFGTNFSALMCQNRNCDGIILPETFLIKGLDWTCNKCNHKVTAGFINCTYEHVQNALGIAKFCMSYEEFIKNNKKLLPENHCYIVDAKIDLLFTLGSLLGMSVISNRHLQLKISLCREVMEFLPIIIPAEKGVRGDILHELQESLKEMYRRKKIIRTPSSAHCVDILKERQSLLREVIEITRFKYGEEEQHQSAKAELRKVEDLLARLNQKVAVGIRNQV